MKKNTDKDTLRQNANDIYPGATIDTADDERDTERLIKERTRTLDDNPRDNDGPKD